ncbi:hypothetical protein D9M72_424540 [compost metagenome]
MVTVNQYLIIIDIAYVHCHHALPFVFELGLEMAFSYRFCVGLCRSFFYSSPIVGIMEHSVDIVGIKIGPFA